MADSYQTPTVYKIAAESRLFIIDFSRFSEIINNDTIASSSIPAVSGLTIGTPSTLTTSIDGVPANKGVKVNISGGTAGTTYTVDCQVTTAAGSIIVRRFQIQVI